MTSLKAAEHSREATLEQRPEAFSREAWIYLSTLFCKIIRRDLRIAQHDATEIPYGGARVLRLSALRMSGHMRLAVSLPEAVIASLRRTGL